MGKGGAGPWVRHSRRSFGCGDGAGEGGRAGAGGSAFFMGSDVAAHCSSPMSEIRSQICCRSLGKTSPLLYRPDLSAFWAYLLPAPGSWLSACRDLGEASPRCRGDPAPLGPACPSQRSEIRSQNSDLLPVARHSRRPFGCGDGAGEGGRAGAGGSAFFMGSDVAAHCRSPNQKPESDVRCQKSEIRNQILLPIAWQSPSPFHIAPACLRFGHTSCRLRAFYLSARRDLGKAPPRCRGDPAPLGPARLTARGLRPPVNAENPLSEPRLSSPAKYSHYFTLFHMKQLLFPYLGLAAHVGPERFGYRDRAVLPKIVFKESYQHSRRGDDGVVESMRKILALFAVYADL